MKTYLPAALAGFGLFAAACQAPAPPPEPEDPAFANAVNFDCDGGSKLDLVFDGADVKVRLDKGAGVALKSGPQDQNAMVYSDGARTLRYDGAEQVTYSTGDGAKSCRFVSRSLDAPKAEGVVRTLTEADAGKSFEIKTGEKIAVALVGVPTAGYVWGASSPPAWVKASDGPGGATTTAQFLPGYAGGNHWEVVIIEALAAGEGEITLAQRRPWETTAEPDAATFKFRLKAT